MHRIQKQLLDFIAVQSNFPSLSLRKMAELIGVPNKPQIVKYHLQQLEKDGLIQINLQEGIIKLVKAGYNKSSTSPIYSVPVVGSANCGPATIFATENISQYLKVSSSLLPRNKKNLFALIADGSSMNKAVVEHGKTIENGDFLLVDSEYRNYRNGDIVVAVIDGMATIKRLLYDLTNKLIVLKADSTENYLPIFLHEGDDFLLNGKVVGIIKAS